MPITAEVNYHNIPDELKSLRQWVCWKWGERDGKPTKIPVNFNGGRPADTTKPETWGKFVHCERVAEDYNGLGFVFTADTPYLGIDLDHCIDEDGQIEPWARKLINRFDTYTEFSQSGRGIHLIAKGTLPAPPAGERKRHRTSKFPNIELYEQERYFVMTGNLVPNTTGAIQPCQNEIDALYHEMFGGDEGEQDKPGRNGNGKKSTGVVVTAEDDEEYSASDIPDNELIARACKSKNGATFKRLWDGDTSAHGNDDSAADQALCNHLAWWTGKDPERVDRLFRQSGLYRSKWERPDYRDRTIGRAIADCPDDGYKPRRQRKRKASKAMPAEGEPGGFYKLTDYGNAERLVASHGDNIRFDVDAGRWLVWDSTRWIEDRTGAAERFAKATVRDMYAELPHITDLQQRNQFYRHVQSSESLSRLRAALTLAQSEPGIPVDSNSMDADHWLLNCANGTIDLRTGELHPHDRAQMITKVTPVSYDPAATCPAWEAFLHSIFADDEELITFIQRAVGYSLTGDTSEQVFFILYGCGCNGKSTLLNVLREIVGEYSMQTSTDTILEKNNGGIPNDVARLRGARLVTAVETQAGRRLAEALVKQVTGDEPISARFLRQEFFEFRPTFKLWLACNHKPRIDGTDKGIWRRVRLIPFDVQYQDSDSPEGPYKDFDLPDKLYAERPGILAWAVRGCLDWQRHRLNKPRAVREATDTYQADMDVLGAFLGECCVTIPQASVAATELYKAYVSWSEAAKERPVSQKWFGISLSERGLYTKYRGNGRVYWRGIGLIHAQNDDSDVDGYVEDVDYVDKKPCSSHEEKSHEKLREIGSTPSTSSTSAFGGIDDDEEMNEDEDQGVIF